MAPLKVIALISGGKDSIFSAIHCIANSHELVALANLYPAKPASQGEEVDSHMYQTVGHTIIPLYAQALGIPLYRRPISGSAVEISQTYTNRAVAGDETEDLLPLLQEAMQAQPLANAICTGAILSTYQRTRVEAIAARLGLTPLSYLWQYPYLPPTGHTSLLLDMEAVGIDARIVKVASGGLGKRHLWLNVASLATAEQLVRDMTCFGHLDVGSTIGEGGEFETLCVDGPAPLWKKRLAVQFDTLEGDAGVCSLVSTGAQLLPKLDTRPAMVSKPLRWDADSLKTIGELAQRSSAKDSHAAVVYRPKSQAPRPLIPALNMRGSLLSIVNQFSVMGSGKMEFENALQKLDSDIRQANLEPANIDFVTILLRQMSAFEILNDAYGCLFSRPLPPARVAIACGEVLPLGVDVVLSCIARRTPRGPRRGLHVQSLSYWAPANIGPYSQSITSPLGSVVDQSAAPTAVVYIAGQIPLVPESMDLMIDNFQNQAMLAFQHMTRIGRAEHAHVWASAVACIALGEPGQPSCNAATALGIWHAAHSRVRKEDNPSDAEDFDVGNRHLHHPWSRAQSTSVSPNTTVHLPPLPNLDCIEGGESGIPPCFVAEVAELPRNAPIEWIGLGLSLGQADSGEQEKCVVDTSSNGAISVTTKFTGHIFGTAYIYTEQGLRIAETLKSTTGDTSDLEHLEAWVAEDIGADCFEWLEEMGAQVVPCTSIWTDRGRAAAAVRWRACSSYNSPNTLQG